MSHEYGRCVSPEELADKAAITEVLHLHSRGLDRQEETTLSRAYWPEATVDYGLFKGPASHFVPLVISALNQSYQLTRHSISNVMIELDADQAVVECHVLASHLLPSGTEEMLFFSRYLDRMEKRDNRWRIGHRQVVMDWSRRHEFEDERESEAYADFAKGNVENDPLSVFLSESDKGDPNE